MNIIKCLFMQEFGEILEQTKEDEIFNGIVFLRMLKDLSHKGVITIPPILKSALEESLLMKPILIPPSDTKENWLLIQKLLKHNGCNIEAIISKVLQLGRSVEIHIFIYEFFNAYRKFKDSSNAHSNSKQSSSQLEIHNDITSISQCAHLFEKLVFLLAKSAGIRPLEVSLEGPAVFLRKFDFAKKDHRRWE